MGTGSAGRRRRHGVLRAPTGLGAGAVTANERQRSSVGGGARGACGYGEGAGALGQLWACGGAGGGLLLSSLGWGYLGVQELQARRRA